MGPGNIFNQRCIPLRPTFRNGLFSAVTKLLGGRRNVADLHEELSQVIVAFRNDEPDQARIRLGRILKTLREIKRNGSQFVLDESDWLSIDRVNTEALAAADQSNANQDLSSMLRTVEDMLKSFAIGKIPPDPVTFTESAAPSRASHR